MKDGYKILIAAGDGHFGVDLRIGEVKNGVLYVAKPVQLVFEPCEIGRRIPPTMEFETVNGLEFLDALKEGLESHRGIREGHVDGELKAMKAHLNDMRLMTFRAYGLQDWTTEPQVGINRRK